MKSNPAPFIVQSLFRNIKNIAEKQQLARSLASRLKNNDIVGVGSGSTSYLALLALAERCKVDNIGFTAITTSIEMDLVCASLSIPTTGIGQAVPTWSFDGADEIDPNGNMLKGRGGALLREKLLMKTSPEVHIVADGSKFVDRLGKIFPVPVEINKEAVQLVWSQLSEIPGVIDLSLRLATGKDGPVITESGNLLLDVRFDEITPDLEAGLKNMTGVVETGIFWGYNPIINR